jgi:ribose 1,5-bisphosphokinase
MRGTLVLVVGPSGAGKDSVIAGAAALLDRDDRIIFARRLITRATAADGEAHLAVSPAAFDDLRRQGGLLLHWRAHGFDYGLPQSLAPALEAGRSVVANVSRAVVGDARRRFAPARVVAVSASRATLALRLAARGRESTAEIEHRLDRAGAISPDQADFVINNDGPLEAAVARFTALLRQIADQPDAASRSL